MQYLFSGYTGSGGSPESSELTPMSETVMSGKMSVLVGKIETAFGDAVMCQIEGSSITLTASSGGELEGRLAGAVELMIEKYARLNNLSFQTS